MVEPNLLYYGDNLDVLRRHVRDESVDLVYLELTEIVPLERSHGRDALVASLERAVTFRRFGAADVRSILAAGSGVATATRAGDDLSISLPSVPIRPLSADALEPVR